MSQQRTSSVSRPLTSSLNEPSSISSPTPSNANPPPPTHKPTATPVIAGSLAGFVLLTVCVITFLLLHKRQRRLRKERALLALQNYDPTTLPRNHLGKSSAPNGYALPQAHDSAFPSGSTAASPPVPASCHEDAKHQHHPHNHHPRPRSATPRRHNHRNDHTPHHQPQPKSHTQLHHSNQLPTSTSSAHSQVPLSSHHSHPPTHGANSPSTDTRNYSQRSMNLHSNDAAPHGHPDIVVGIDKNKDAGRTGHGVIFGHVNDSDADARMIREELGGSRAGVPAIVVTRDMEDPRNGEIGGSSWVGRDRSESPPAITNGIPGGNGNELGRNWIPGGNGGSGHARVQAHGQGSGIDHGDEGAPSRGIGLMPESAGQGSYARQRTASGSTSGSSLPSSLFPLVVPPSPTTSIASSARNLSTGARNTQQLNTERNTNTVVDGALLSPFAMPITSRACVGLTQTHMGSGVVDAAEEDAPPAYENVWATAREEEGRHRVDTKRVEQDRDREMTT